LKIRVEELTLAGEMVRIIAYLDHPIIARAAFRAAVEQYPSAHSAAQPGAGNGGAQAEMIFTGWSVGVD